MKSTRSVGRPIGIVLAAILIISPAYLNSFLVNSLKFEWVVSVALSVEVFAVGLFLLLYLMKDRFKT